MAYRDWLEVTTLNRAPWWCIHELPVNPSPKDPVSPPHSPSVSERTSHQQQDVRPSNDCRPPAPPQTPNLSPYYAVIEPL
jgi:hypothetical protein